LKPVTAGQGLKNVADSMQSAMDTLADSIATASKGGAVDPSARKAAAIATIEEEEGLSEGEFDTAVELIMANAEAANMDLAIKKPAARTRFLQSQLEKFRHS
jgi:hypothetical protein